MRERLKWMLPALLAFGVVGFFLAARYRSNRRIEAYGVAIGRYDEYSKAYADCADKKRYQATTCYGGEWNQYVGEIVADIESHKDDAGYLRSRSAHFSKLKSMYQAAVSHPEAEITLDPPLGP